MDYHIVCEKFALGSLFTRYVSSKNQLAYIFTKPFPRASFHDLRFKLGLWPYPQPSLRESDEEDKGNNLNKSLEFIFMNAIQIRSATNMAIEQKVI